jgi:D-sedoheptulose 7-phosphate isomerase
MATTTFSDWTKIYVFSLIKLLSQIDVEALEKTSDILLEARKKGKTIYIIGNGGSASTALHFATDLTHLLDRKDRTFLKPFKAISLTANVSALTAVSNDIGYDQSFCHQLEVHAGAGDVLIAISSSGNSPNIIQCVQLAKKMRLSVVGISGFGGGKLKDLADVALVSDHNAYGQAEDMQLIVNHILASYFHHIFLNEKTFSSRKSIGARKSSRNNHHA